MNAFLNRALLQIKEQTGVDMLICKIAFDKTHSINGAIKYIRNLTNHE